MLFYFPLRTATLMMVLATALPVWGEQWVVPLAGNAFRCPPQSTGRLFDRSGNLVLGSADNKCCIYMYVDRPATLALAVQGRASEGQVELQAVVDQQKLLTFLKEQSQSYALGDVVVTEPGYVRVDLTCRNCPLGRQDEMIAEMSELLVTSNTPGLVVHFVKSNDGNMFYWGRRGPSVHLAYQLPPDRQLTYAYSEIEVPAGQDPIGSYFMANGFGEGYFGIQVNAANERRVLFSVWSPFKTDNPAEIPADQRVVTLAKGADVKAQDFGNEGSGGQSFLVYPWKAGVTYRFLTEVKPDGQGNTQYTAWFGDKQAGDWRLIASFRRPQTNKHLTGFHSFLESFNPEYGHMERSAQYGNQWVCDVNGVWFEITHAKFTGDNTARGHHRLDFAGGAADRSFYLRNCGFFDADVALDQVFHRQSTADAVPQIEFIKLPR